MLENRPVEWSEKTNRLYEELNSKINEYIMSVFEDSDVLDHGDYIDSWALVMNYANMENTRGSSGYVMESFPATLPPHSIKGLFREGIACVQNIQDEVDDDDE